MSRPNSKAIGIFDSGIGGLTVAKEITHLLPNEHIIYIGDTARVPYGTRGNKVITEFATQLAKFLLKQEVKFLVIACNTISATCLETIQQISPVPVIGVIKPTVTYTLSITKNNFIGILGTPTTINSQVYNITIHALRPQTKIISQACPLFVPLVEEGLLTHPGTKIFAKEYLSVFRNTQIDTIILGCTHYPLLSSIIKEVVGPEVVLVDSAKPTAFALQDELRTRQLLNNVLQPKREFYFTDITEKEHDMMDLLFGDHVPYTILSASLDD